MKHCFVNGLTYNLTGFPLFESIFSGTEFEDIKRNTFMNCFVFLSQPDEVNPNRFPKRYLN